MSIQDKIQSQIDSHPIVVYMKGTKDFPMCGFSASVVETFKSMDVPFETINILEDEDLRSGIKEYSNWPTIPQIFIGGEFVGGCDIIKDMHEAGELQEMIDGLKEAGKIQESRRDEFILLT